MLCFFSSLVVCAFVAANLLEKSKSEIYVLIHITGSFGLQKFAQKNIGRLTQFPMTNKLKTLNFNQLEIVKRSTFI